MVLDGEIDTNSGLHALGGRSSHETADFDAGLKVRLLP